MRWRKLIGLLIPLLASVVAGQGADAPPRIESASTPEAEPARLSGVLGVTLASHYFFRGIRQENQGLILQPSLELNYSLFEGGAGVLTSSTLTLGAWNSVHNGPSGSHGSLKHWYESDLYAGVGVGLFGCGKASAIYTAYTSPNDAFPTVQEVALGLSYDDKPLWGGDWFSGLQPSATVALEYEGQADLGTDRGIYAELALQPAFTVDLGADLPLTLAAPITLGCSLHDYFERNGRDDTFGYLDVGFAASLPVRLRRPTGKSDSGLGRFGSWTLSAGVDLLFFGDNTRAINGGDELKVIGSVALTCAF